MRDHDVVGYFDGVSANDGRHGKTSLVYTAG
jgi:hypothetical protein